MSLQKDLIEIRKKIVSAMRSELMGPGSEISYPDADHELISEYPTKRYSVGILFPKDESFEGNMSRESSEIESEENERVVDENEEETDSERKSKKLNMHQYDSLDEEVNMSQQTKPSSMGLTFFVSGNIQSLKINIEYAKYLPTSNNDIIIPYPLEEDLFIPDCLSPYISFNKENRTIKKLCSIKLTELDEIFERNGIEDASLLNLIRSLNTIFRSSEKAYRRQPFNEEIILNFDSKMVKMPLGNANAYITAVKHYVEEGIYSITVMMVNDESKGGIPIFQPRITIDSSNLNGLKFVSYNSLSNTSNFSDEEKSLDLLYRNKLIYATGHGVSVDWDIYESNGKIFTEFMPLFEVAKVDLNLRQNTAKERAVNKRSLSMKYLSDLDETDKTIKISDMEQFINCYFDWIESLQYECTNLEERYQQVANKHLSLCRESFSRMQKGLSILRTDSNAWDAFQLTNRAMFMQRIHSAFQKKEHYPNDFDWQAEISNVDYKKQNDDNCRWRPFQLAFLLMTIRSIVDSKCSERELVDLIWFPTGGGKTEAYLGLTAFTIFHRRLLNCNNAGTTVLMRYTLRLLTSQQFTRASTLICACEKIRRNEEEKKNPQYSLGAEKITIGLYIGGNHIPNTNKDALENYENLNDKSKCSSLKYRKEKYNKFQVLKCPWCGTKLTKDFINRNECGAWGYKFRKEKHFYLSCTQENCEFEDELPIQIIDEELYKKPPTLLFSTVDKFAMMTWKSDVYSFFGNKTNDAPDLIIQDELHLISGPLGTMVGIYETAIDFLCSYKGRKPKIVASTATIRQAVQQCRALYNRDVRQFPSPGLDASDSFFAKEIPTDKEFGRAYLGIMPSGKTKVMLQARATAMALQFVHQLDCSDQLKDQFYTLTIYFNSLKELGKASSVVSDDVKDFIKRIAYRQIINTPSSRTIGIPYELTSRVNTSELNDTLEKLENNVYNKENQKYKKYPIHVLLASNMISVGVDISRLNLMFLQGQPKMVSEYIQASSRIGRANPGLAITLYDASKSRDRSYYEQFKAFHSAFYKYVEPAGVTPFSAQARDRALHATLISEIRHSIEELRKNASHILDPQVAERVAACANFIYDRIKTINSFNPKGMKDDSDDILNELSIFINEWKNKASAYENLSYGNISNKAKFIPRLIKRFDDECEDAARMTLTSLRNVDRTVPVSVLIWEDEHDEKN